LKDILLITPPFTQLNTPYPATAYLKGFLNNKKISSFQMDLGIEVILSLFSKEGLQSLFEHALLKKSIRSDNAKKIYKNKKKYFFSIGQVVAFLQGKNQSLAKKICAGHFLPRASRFGQHKDELGAFGSMSLDDKAKHLATLYLEDLSDFIVECADKNFGFSRYAESLGRCVNSFDDLYEQLQKDESYIDVITLAILDRKLKKINPRWFVFQFLFRETFTVLSVAHSSLKKIMPLSKPLWAEGFQPPS